jgi:hypothetical protein
MAEVRKAKALGCCWRQVSRTVGVASTKRLPAALRVPNGKSSSDVSRNTFQESLPIVAYRSMPVSVKALTNKIKVIKRMAYGYRDDDTCP